jgi:C4-dicarboxylate transporter DctM subunit
MTWVLVLLPLALLVLGLPIYLVLLTASTVLILFFLNVPLSQVPLTMFGSIDKFALMAVPFYIFAGELMGRGGLSQRIIDWVLSMIGGIRGSLALTTVGTCTVFGAISGSSPATVAAVGKLMHPAMARAGYEEGFSVPLLASAGSIALIIPPSIAMILYGAVAEQSITQLFIAGIVPGLLLSILLALYILLVARQLPLQEGGRFNAGQFLRATRMGAWAIGAPVIILGGIYLGIFSPTEAAGVVCVYAILVTRFVYRDITWREIFAVAVQSMRLTAQILLIVAAAGVFAWLLTITGMSQLAVGFVKEYAISPWTVLLAMNLLLLLVGCFLDPNSAILVLTPLLVPICEAFNIDLIHFGIVLTVNLAIGMFTPPFGLNLFVAQAVFKTPLSVLYRGLVPFFLVYLVGLALITYIPSLSLHLVRT